MLKTNKRIKKVPLPIVQKSLLCIVLNIMFFSGSNLKAQTIAPYLFGQNAWLTDTIGTGGTMQYYGGQLKNNWQKVKDSKFTSVRIGGIGYDRYGPTVFQLLKLIDSIQINGGEPIVQISNFDNNGITYTAAMAGARVTAINVTNIGSLQRKVKYWEISNEPDGYAGNHSTTQIATYTKAFATQMKLADSTILIIAPQLSSYKPPAPSINRLTIDSLTNTSIATTDITGSVPGHTYGYVDFIGFHFYPFDGSYNPATRDSIINHITANTKFKSNLDALNLRLNTANSNHSRTSNPLKIAITEANMVNTNPLPALSDTLATGLSANSFIAGQFWAEILEYCMKDSVQFLNFWSVLEGTGQNSATDRGYLRQVNASKRPTWFHFKMVAENFKGTFKPNLYTSNLSTYKAFGYKNTAANEVGVIVMNQDLQSPRGTDTSVDTLRINFNNSAPTSLSDMKFYFNDSASAIPEYHCSITNETTMLLVFDITSGALIRKEVYNLGDALRTIDTGPEVWNLTSTTPITTQDQFNSYYDAVYSDLVISPPVGGITEVSTDSKTFRFSNTATINGDFEVPLGAEFTLLPTVTCP
jgi:hypothetical protein